MIKGLGIDAVEVNRFIAWTEYPHTKLARIFSQKEIDYCLSVPTKAPERLAAHFATREAFFKAISSAYPEHDIPFLTLCKKIELQANKLGAPVLQVDWQGLQLPQSFVHISITHTKTTATVVVILC